MKHFEFWHPRLFELPYYLYLAGGAAVRGLGIRSLAKANWALDHGEIGIGSKYRTQQAFDQARFLPTRFLPAAMPAPDKVRLLNEFVDRVGVPIVLKSDIGSVGKGVVRVDDAADLPARVAQLAGPYLAQQFTPFNAEYGVFYVRTGGRGRITGINKKHFPTVVGDGVRSIGALARAHPRFTDHWHTFLQYRDLGHVPAADERVQLSFIGSHTMGCMFTDDTGLRTPALEEAIVAVAGSCPGFNFGRLDVKAEDEAAFCDGRFVVIEVNGVASLPTHMFDPKHSVLDAYRIFLRHGSYLLQAAAENRHRDMAFDSYRGIVRRVRENAATLNTTHRQLMGRH